MRQNTSKVVMARSEMRRRANGVEMGGSAGSEWQGGLRGEGWRETKKQDKTLQGQLSSSIHCCEQTMVVVGVRVTPSSRNPELRRAQQRRGSRIAELTRSEALVLAHCDEVKWFGEEGSRE